MENNKNVKTLISAFVLVLIIAVAAVVIVFVKVNNTTTNKDDGEIQAGQDGKRNNSSKNESFAYAWEPTSISYVPEDIGEKIAKSIDRAFHNATDPYDSKLFNLNDKQRYAVIIACMYSYDNLDKAGQAKVECFEEMSKKYEELYLSLNGGTADTDGQTHNYGADGDKYFDKSVTVKKELYKEGKYIVDSYDVSIKRNIFGDPYLSADPNYTKTSDIYLYTFDVTYTPNNLGTGEVTNGPVHVYFNGEYAGDVTFNNSNSASGQFAIKSTNSNYTANDFDSLFTSIYGDVEWILNYTSDAAPYKHELFSDMEIHNDMYYDDMGDIYPGANVENRSCFWPGIYRPGAKSGN